MKTAIRVALSDDGYGGDQKSCEYDSVADVLTVNKIDIEDVYQYRSGVNGYGLIYDTSSKTESGIFVYRSNKKINGYEGYDIRTGAKELLSNSPDSPKYAVQYLGSEPEWISDGVSIDIIRQNLKGSSWLKICRPMSSGYKNFKVLAIIVDKLLQALKDGKTAAIGLVDSEGENGLEEIREVLFCVLNNYFPAIISNRISFNTNANENVAGMDIFCTTLAIDKYESQGCTIVDIKKGLRQEGRFVEDYEFHNPYAEYIATGGKTPSSREWAGISDIEQLNHAGNLKLLALECRKIRKYSDNEALKKLANRMESCQDLQEDEKIRIALSKIAYHIFFSECYFAVSEENKAAFRPFLAILKTDEDLNNIGVQLSSSKIEATLKSIGVQGDMGREYIRFLTECKDKLPPRLKSVIQSYLDALDPRTKWGRVEAQKFLKRVTSYHDDYYKPILEKNGKRKTNKDWIKQYKNDRSKRSDKESVDAYSPKVNVVIGEALMTALACIIAFCIIHFFVYPLVIGEWLPYHALSENRFLIEGAFATLLLAVGLGKIIYDTINYREKTTSLSVACVCTFLEGLALSLAVIALTSVVLCILFIIL